MSNNRKPTPSMKSLELFEATYRLGSMTAAAREQGTTQPVVSQRIRALEDSLGCTLFDRIAGRLTPTHQGRFLYGDISSALSKINTSLNKLRDDALDLAPSISIAANYGFAHLWLLPRLKGLQQSFPRYTFDVTPADSDSCAEVFEADISIRFGEFAGSSSNEVLLAPELVYPVCSPEFAERNNLNGRVDALVLERASVLHMDNNDPRWLDWRRWCLLAGVPPVQASTGFKFNNYPLLISAAIRGDGVALGWSSLVQDAIAQGSLIALQPQVARSDHGYILKARHYSNCTIQPVFDWFCRELSPHGSA